MDDFPVRCMREEKLPDDGFDVSELLTEIYRKQNETSWTRKTGVYHPSGIGGCKRSLYYDVSGAEPQKRTHPKDRALFDLGHAIHEKLQERLLSFRGFDPERVANFRPLKLYGHCDGVFTLHDWILEIKSIGDSSFKILTKPKKEHVLQVHCYMIAFDIPRAQLLYVNRDSGVRRNFRVFFSYETWREVVDTIVYVDNCVEAGTPPPKEPNLFWCRSCKFNHICEPDKK